MQAGGVGLAVLLCAVPVCMAAYLESSTCPELCTLNARVLRCSRLRQYHLDRLMRCLQYRDYVLVLDVINSGMQCSCDFVSVSMEAFRNGKVPFGPFPCSLLPDLKEACKDSLLPPENFLFLGRQFSLSETAWAGRIKSHVDWVMSRLEDIPDTSVRQHYIQMLLVVLLNTTRSIKAFKEDRLNATTTLKPLTAWNNGSLKASDVRHGSESSGAISGSGNDDLNAVFQVLSDGSFRPIAPGTASEEEVPSDYYDDNGTLINATSIRWHSSRELAQLLRRALANINNQAYNRRMEIIVFGCLAAIFIAIIIAFLVAKLESQRKQSLMELREGRQDEETAHIRRRLTLWESFLSKLRAHSRHKLSTQNLQSSKKPNTPASVRLLKSRSDTRSNRSYGTHSQRNVKLDRSNRGNSDALTDLAILNLNAHSSRQPSNMGPPLDKNKSNQAQEDSNKNPRPVGGLSSFLRKKRMKRHEKAAEEEKPSCCIFDRTEHSQGCEAEKEEDLKLTMSRERFPIFPLLPRPTVKGSSDDNDKKCNMRCLREAICRVPPAKEQDSCMDSNTKDTSKVANKEMVFPVEPHHMHCESQGKRDEEHRTCLPTEYHPTLDDESDFTCPISESQREARRPNRSGDVAHSSLRFHSSGPNKRGDANQSENNSSKKTTYKSKKRGSRRPREPVFVRTFTDTSPTRSRERRAKRHSRKTSHTQPQQSSSTSFHSFDHSPLELGSSSKTHEAPMLAPWGRKVSWHGVPVDLLDEVSVARSKSKAGKIRKQSSCGAVNSEVLAMSAVERQPARGASAPEVSRTSSMNFCNWRSKRARKGRRK